MLEEDLILKRKISNYFSYVLRYGIDIKENDYVEILTTSYIDNYLDLLIKELEKYNANIIITYTDGLELENILNLDNNKYLNEKIEMYYDLIKKKFKRLTIVSPFLVPVTNSKNIEEYKRNSYKLMFVREYFFNNPHTIFAVANENWAMKLGLKIEELWDNILNYAYKSSPLEYFKGELDLLKLDKLYFETSLGTKLYVGLTDDFEFIGNRWKIGDTTFLPNIPSLEIFTSPDKYRVDGILVSSKPLYYNNIHIEKYKIEFKNGKIIYQEGLDELLKLDSNLMYAGEIALVLGYDPKLFYTILLDENLACHLALGNSYSKNIKDTSRINKSKYHIDLVFGYTNMKVDGIDKEGKIIPLIRNDKLILSDEIKEK